MNQFTLPDVVRMTGIPYHKIYWQHYKKRLAEPSIIGRTRIYTDKDIARIKEHFSTRKAAE